LNNINLKKLRNQILEQAKKHVEKKGWSEQILLDVARDSKFKYSEIALLFPKGYSTLLEMYLNTINDKMTEGSRKINLIQLRVHQRIKELIVLRLRIMSNEKKLISKTYFHLLLPQNFKLASKCLYKVVDQTWFLAGDQSTDFNFYTKRGILASIYSTVILHFINNNNLDQTIDILNKQLKRVSKIPKIKNKFKKIKDIIPRVFKLINNIGFLKQ